jgi:hypothetical protein
MNFQAFCWPLQPLQQTLALTMAMLDELPSFLLALQQTLALAVAMLDEL